MATYFSIKKHPPLPTGVNRDEVITRIVEKVGELGATVETLAKTPRADEYVAEASRVLSTCKAGLFKTLTPNNPQTMAPTAEPATPAAPIEEVTSTRRP